MSRTNLGYEMMLGAGLGVLGNGALVALGVPLEHALLHENGLFSAVETAIIHNPLLFFVISAVTGAVTAPVLVRTKF